VFNATGAEAAPPQTTQFEKTKIPFKRTLVLRMHLPDE
jgi:hypothetical protein